LTGTVLRGKITPAPDLAPMPDKYLIIEPPPPFDPLSESRRRAVFACLVAAQDRGAGVELSRRAVAARFGLTLADVARIEAEGLAQNWPLPELQA
jgi:hypothetical protein